MRQKASVDPGSEGRFASNYGESANTAAVITVPAIEKEFPVVQYVSWSYSGTPTGGLITIAIGGTTVWSKHITQSGWDGAIFGSGLYNQAQTENENLVVTLAAGGAGVTGFVDVKYK